MTMSQADILFAEEIAIKMLTRLQARGVTSKPAASAPAWAKKEATERLAAIEKEKARKAQAQTTTPPQ
jgi:ribosomal protein L14E/L6E/L27E